MSLFDIPELNDGWHQPDAEPLEDVKSWLSSYGIPVEATVFGQPLPDAPPLRTESDAQALAQALSPPPRLYPCHRCSNNVSIIATGDPQRPATAVCDPCGHHPNVCTCERVTNAST